MGVYIKCMEMPKSCGCCPLMHGTCEGDECYVGAHITEYQKIPDDCPLVPVPPHGRLIDADAIRQSLKESIDECHKLFDGVEGGEMYARVSQGTFLECSLRVKAAPTIIPAEESE